MPRHPGDPRPFPPPDAVIVAPATFDTLNERAAGIAGTLAADTPCEAYGPGVPLAVLPCVADAPAAHPAYRENPARPRGMGVRFGGPYAGEAGEDGGPPEFGRERALELIEGGSAPGP